MGKVKSNSQEKKRKKNCNGTKRPIHKYSEKALRDALFEIRENNVSVRKASRIYGVPKTTLHDRLSGRIAEKPRKMGPPPVLNEAEEKAIVEWCVNLAKSGFPRKMDDVLNTVQKIILSKVTETNNANKKIPFVNGRPGKKWYSAFFRRNPELVHRSAENLSKGRAVLTVETIKKWFDDLKQYLKTENAEEILQDPTRIYNGDETSLALCPKTGKIIAPRGHKNVYQIVSGKEKEALTVLLVVSASGAIAHPCVVFPYLRPPKDIRESMDPSWCLGLSETGWMRSEVFYEYVANSFNPWLEASNIKKPILFFIDGHKSHLTMSLSEFCTNNGIILYALPPNATHIIQPCDVSVFKPLKTDWQATVREWQMNEMNINQVLTKAKFCPLLKKVLQNPNLPESIRNGFRRCGLFPFDPNAVDYSKCVQNVLEKLDSNNETNTTPITNEYIEITTNTLRALQSNLEDRGVDVEIIFEELLKAKKSTGNKENNLEELPPISIFAEGNIYDVDEDGNLNIVQGEVIQLQEEDTLVADIDDLQTYHETEDLAEKTIIQSIETKSIPNDTENEHTLIPNYNHKEKPASSKVQILSIVTIPPKTSTISDQILVYPKPIEKGKRQKCTKGPSAISSEMWRKLEMEKENAKQRKIRAVQERKEEARKRREAKQAKAEQNKFIRRRKPKKSANSRAQDENIPNNDQAIENNNNTSQKNRVQCSSCETELISDTEENDLKNVGCDQCPRWYHLKCTSFKGNLYEDICAKEFTCLLCKE